MKKFLHNIIAIALYFATAGLLSLASLPVIGNLARSVFEPMGLWGNLWFLIPFVLLLCAVSGAWTLFVCTRYFRLTEWCAKRRGLSWVAIQSW